jgi:hypothetical protein
MASIGFEKSIVALDETLPNVESHHEEGSQNARIIHHRGKIL